MIKFPPTLGILFWLATIGAWLLVGLFVFLILILFHNFLDKNN